VPLPQSLTLCKDLYSTAPRRPLFAAAALPSSFPGHQQYLRRFFFTAGPNAKRPPHAIAPVWTSQQTEAIRRSPFVLCKHNDLPLDEIRERIVLRQQWESALSCMQQTLSSPSRLGSPGQRDVVPYGGILGTPTGVACVAYSNGNEDHFSHEASEAFDLRAVSLQHAQCAAKHAGFLNAKELLESVRVVGVKWQCVEYARRYLLMAKAVWLRSVPVAEGIWTVKDMLHLPSGNRVNTIKLENGKTLEAPVPGDLIIWRRTRDVPFGHVAAVVAVEMRANSESSPEQRKPTANASHVVAIVYIAEQNHAFHAWTGGYSRRLELLRHANGALELLDDEQDPILGWVRVEAPDVDFTSHDIPDAFAAPTTNGTIVRLQAERDTSLPWLRPHESPCDFFVKRSLVINGNLGDGAVAAEKDTPDGCYVMDGDMWAHVRKAAHTLHDVAMAATWRVLNHPHASSVLEAYFGVPPELHDIVRHSLHKLPCMFGRFDFGYDGEKLTMLEYNCDSSAALYECYDTQGKWAEYMGPPYNVGSSSGSFLYHKMKDYFTSLAANPELSPESKLIHFMVDDDDEERYTALCAAHCAQECGFRFKICVKLTDFRFAPRSASATTPFDATLNVDEGGAPILHATAAPWRAHLDSVDVVDLEGERVQLVWKTWSWDTVLHQYKLQRTEARGVGSPEPTLRHPTLTDVLLNRRTEARGVDAPEPTLRHPTLSDVLLNRRIHTLEPAWKMITGSKALLPFMHEVSPDHPNMVHASFRRTDRMLKKPYLSKPVNGRAGQNITMYDAVESEEARAVLVKEDVERHGRIVPPTSSGTSPAFTPLSPAPAGTDFFTNAQTSDCDGTEDDHTQDKETSEGRFFDSLLVYQRRVVLKKFSHHYYPIFCGWMVGEAFGGVVVREDTSKITKLGSIVAPCRVVRGQLPASAFEKVAV
jgi:glutathionylspermidine synthase